MKQQVIRSLDAAEPLIRRRLAFRNQIREVGEVYLDKMPSFSAEALDAPPIRWRQPGAPPRREWGALPERYAESIDTATYIVFSYKTPIAWWATLPHTLDGVDVAELLDGRYGEWVVPAVTYSLTTTNHQSIVRSALSGHRWYAPEREDIPFSSGWGEFDERVPCGTGRRGY